MALREDCRLLGHAWDEVAGNWTPLFGGDPHTFRCARCDTERREVWGTNTGELVSRNYVYTQGYQYERGEEKPDRQQLRLLWVLEQMDQAAKRRYGRIRKARKNGPVAEVSNG